LSFYIFGPFGRWFEESPGIEIVKFPTYTFARAAIVSAALAATLGGASRAESAAVARVDVEVKDTACHPDDLNVPAGGVIFSIHNATTRALEWEILDGVMVVDERENIGPGQVESLTTKLSPGEYQITCGFASNPKGHLHVAGLPGAPARVRQVELIGPLAEYRVYLSYEIDGLVDDITSVAGALKSGDVETARKAFASARAHYARMTPIAMFFPDLDGDVEPHGQDAAAADSDDRGFRQLEWDLFVSKDPRGGMSIAEKLVAEARTMQAQFEDMLITPKPMFLGMSGAVGGSAPALINDQSDRPNAIALSDLRSDIEGARKIADLFRPLISRTDSPLSGAMADDFATVASTLAKYQLADGGFGPVGLSAEDRVALLGVTKKLTTEVSRIPAALGVD
jgi:iron uptake system component EfeO